MKLISTNLNGLYEVEHFRQDDHRGSFSKVFNLDFFNSNKVNFKTAESFFSVSKKNVIRGMHFQMPPYDQDKLIYVVRGEIIDVVLDLRAKSSTFGEIFTAHLKANTNRSIYIPKGMAHGFKSLKNNSTIVYNVSTVFNPSFDFGIHYNSFGFDWEILNPIVSQKDESLVSLNDFLKMNPF